MEKLKFIKAFMKNAGEVASVFPSSHFLAKNMAQSIDFDADMLVLELGPGSGAVTRELLNRMSAGSRLVAFETNAEFCAMLQENIRDPRLTIVHDSAAEMQNYLAGERADYIVSGIALAMLSREARAELLAQANAALAEDGRYIQFQYSLESYKALKSVFAYVRLDFTVFNIPSAFVYSCSH